MQKQRVNSATINDFTSLVQNVMTNVQSYVRKSIIYYMSWKIVLLVVFESQF